MGNHEQRLDNLQRFVLLHHQFPTPASSLEDLHDRPRKDHWDLMLEHENELLTWALDSNSLATETISAIRLANHRLSYLDYEGPISNQRGQVTRILSGHYQVWDAHSDRLICISQAIYRGSFRLILETSIRRFAVLFRSVTDPASSICSDKTDPINVTDKAPTHWKLSPISTSASVPE